MIQKFRIEVIKTDEKALERKAYLEDKDRGFTVNLFEKPEYITSDTRDIGGSEKVVTGHWVIVAVK